MQSFVGCTHDTSKCMSRLIIHFLWHVFLLFDFLFSSNFGFHDVLHWARNSSSIGIGSLDFVSVSCSLHAVSLDFNRIDKTYLNEYVCACMWYTNRKKNKYNITEATSPHSTGDGEEFVWNIPIAYRKYSAFKAQSRQWNCFVKLVLDRFQHR